MDDLKELHERIAVCRGQNIALKQKALSYVHSAVAIRWDDSNPPWIIAKAQMKHDVPVIIRTETGQIVNELRSCLDALACTLAKRNGKSVRDVYFPIYKDINVFAEKAAEAVKKLSPEDRSKLLSFQTHGDADPFLYGVHKLDVKRKHIELGLQMAQSSGYGLNNGYVDKLEPFEYTPISIGEEKPIVRVISSKSFTLSFQFDVVFNGPPQLSGIEIIDAIDTFGMKVEQIISAFD